MWHEDVAFAPLLQQAEDGSFLSYCTSPLWSAGCVRLSKKHSDMNDMSAELPVDVLQDFTDVWLLLL